MLASKLLDTDILDQYVSINRVVIQLNIAKYL